MQEKNVSGLNIAYFSRLVVEGLNDNNASGISHLEKRQERRLLMSALLSVTVQVKDFDKLRQYMSQVPETMKEYGAELICRGQVSEILHGSMSHQMEATFRFPAIDSVHAWYQSEEYQALSATRDEAALMNIAILNPF